MSRVAVSCHILLTSKGLEEMEADFGRMARPPGFKTISRFEQAHEQLFGEVLDRIHVWTGSLRAVAATATDYDGKTWSGEMEFGGSDYQRPVAPGPPKDVDYAVFELARGDEHNFLQPVEDNGPAEYGEALKGWFDDCFTGEREGA